MSRQELSSIHSNESEMLSAFKSASLKVLSEEERFIKNDQSVKCGLEVEYALVDDKYFPATEDERNSICEKLDFADLELGASQLEIRTDPINLKDGSHLILDQMIDRENKILDLASERGLSLVRSGTNPFIFVDQVEKSSADRYQIVPDYHNQHRRNDLDTVIGIHEKVDVGNAAVTGLTNSVQLNLEAKNFSDSIDLLNRSLFIGPMVVATFGNARFLELKDTGIEDLRMVAWEISHDTRTTQDLDNRKSTRIGLPTRYYKDLEDYLNSITEYPFILDAPPKCSSNRSWFKLERY